MTCGGKAVGGGIRETDDGIEALIPGEAAGSDSVHEVWGGDGSRVSGRTHADTELEGIGGEPALISHHP